jgi:RNA polymerase sigma-70 factor (ECF subfamily)
MGDADEYAWLHQYCVRLMHDDEVGADLTQETLLEAWRHRDKLVNPHGRRAWLAQIATHVAQRLRRGFHRAARHVTQFDDLTEPWDPALICLDFVQDLERQELAQLLDHALALLPGDLRQALIAHYIEEIPQSELSARLGISQGTLAVRLYRGRLRLQHLFVTELAEEAALFGLDTLRLPTWQETRLWCSHCGRHHLRVLFNRDDLQVLARCPMCGPFIEHQTTLLTGARSYRAALERIWTWADTYYSPAVVRGTAPCVACGHLAQVRKGVPPGAAINNAMLPTIHLACRCGAMNACPMPWLGLASPTGQAFRRDHPRIRLATQLEVEVDGSAAHVSVFESVMESAHLVVTISRDTYRLLTVQVA